MMNISEELTHAKTWFEKLSEEDRSLINGLVHQASCALCEEQKSPEATSVLETLAVVLRTKLGSLASFVLGDKEQVRLILFDNLILILYRISLEKKSISSILEAMISLLEFYFIHFQNFLKTSLKLGSKSFAILEKEAEDCAHTCVQTLFSICFPESERSVAIPFPQPFRSMAQSYLSGIFVELKKNATSALKDLLQNKAQKERLFASLALMVHKRLCLWNGTFSTVKVSKDELMPYQSRIEVVLERAISCLSRDPQQQLRFFPKFQGGTVFLGLLWQLSQKIQKDLPLWTVHFLDHSLRAQETFSIDSKVPLEEVEKRYFSRKTYEPIFFRILKKRFSPQSSSEADDLLKHPFFMFFQSLMKGISVDLASQTFDSIPWDEIFEAVSFSFRRMWNFGLSEEALLFAKDSLSIKIS